MIASQSQESSYSHGFAEPFATDKEWVQDGRGKVHSREVSEVKISSGNPFSPAAMDARARGRERIATWETSDSARNNLRECETMSFLVHQTTLEPCLNQEGAPVRTVFHCDHRLCSACSKRRARVGRVKAEEVVSKFENAPIFATFTHRAVSGRPLSDTYDLVAAALVKLTRRVAWKNADLMGKCLVLGEDGRVAKTTIKKEKPWSVRGAVIAVEVSYNVDNDWWHVHLHCLLDSAYIPQRELLYLWRESLGGVPYYDGDGLGGCLDGGVHLKRASGGGACLELVKYVSKGVSSNFDSYPEERLGELVHWVRGRRLLRFTGAFFGYRWAEEEEASWDIEGAENADGADGAVLGLTPSGTAVGRYNGVFSDRPDHVERGLRQLARHWEGYNWLMERGPDRQLRREIRGRYAEALK